IRELRAKLGQLNFGPKCQDPLVISAGGMELPLVDVQDFINSLGGGGGGSDGGNDVGGFGGGSSGGHWEFHDFDGAGGHPGGWVYVCESGYVDWDENGCQNENEN
ncbi:MAG: hypothetical protein L0338_03065, partial [Acidobacteria bacterium]|nr:hypothetical protein [Acidobacteriota bacterium]